MEIKSENNDSNDSVEIVNSFKEDVICELEHLRKLFIGGLAPYTTEDGLRDFYGQWGKVVDVVVMKDQVTKRSRGFGFITYTKSFMVDKAQENRPHIIDGKTVEAKRALPRPEREAQDNKSVSVKKLFVGGLKDNHDESCLEEYFSQFGKVVSVKILTDKTTGKRRGFAFIEYDDYDAVDKAILQKNHSIKYVIVDVKKSIYSKELQKKNALQHTGNAGGGGGKQDTQNKNQNFRNPMQPQQQQQQKMPPFQERPPPNYNQWGPPAPSMPPQNYGGYQQPPMPTPPQHQQMPNWNYPPAPNTWSGPPQPQGGPQAPPPAWNNNQWGYPPPTGQPCPPGPPGPMPAGPMPTGPMPTSSMPAGPMPTGPMPAGPMPAGPMPAGPMSAGPMPTSSMPPGPMPPGPMPPGPMPTGPMPPNQMPPPGTQPPPNWQQPSTVPPGIPPSVPGPPPAPHHQQPPVQQQGPPPNFGTGYQQNYGGGPTKHQSNMNSNRMNPYSAPPNNTYNNNIQIPPAQAYGGYNAGPPNGKPSGNNKAQGPIVPNPLSNGGASSSGNKYRR